MSERAAGDAGANEHAAHAREHARQAALLEAIASADVEAPAARSAPSMAEEGARRARGLAAYRANAAATAERALAAAFPTVLALVGAEAFGALARRHWFEAPPACGDLGEWGDAFPSWLEREAPLAAWPFIADAARLDLAIHRCERAADAELDAASLQRLQADPPERLAFVLRPGTTLLESRWPIAALHAAHRRVEPDLEAVRAALAHGRGERVLVARRGWVAALHVLDDDEAAFTRAVLAGTDLARALAAPSSRFDLGAWLARALREGWLAGVRAIGGHPAG